jgi:hypothetical protein
VELPTTHLANPENRMVADKPEIVRLVLSPEQYCLLSPILARQRDEENFAVVGFISASYECDAAAVVAKIDVAWLPKKIAQQICNIVRDANRKKDALSNSQKSP